MKTKPLKIVQLSEDEKTLRKESKPIDIEKITTPEVQDFIDQLFATIEDAKNQVGWEAGGISAIQVGKPFRIFIALNYNHNEFEVYINPVVKELGESTDVAEEGCLSIPDTVGKVRRKKRVKVTYYDREGNKQKERYTGYTARTILHEYDHLNGILFTDKIEE
jgi:peptide deformylase